MARGAIAGTLALCTVAALAGGCGQTVLDAGEVGGEIGSRIEELTGAEVESVVCPSDVEAKAGATFTCTVTGTDGTSLDDRRPADERRRRPCLRGADPSHDRDRAGDRTRISATGRASTVRSWCSSRQASRSTARSAVAATECERTVTLKDENGNFDYEVTT